MIHADFLDNLILKNILFKKAIKDEAWYKLF